MNTDAVVRETLPTPLAIVGIGCLFPKADGPGAYWANVKNAVDCIGEVPPTHWNPDDYFDADPKSPDMTYARRGGFLDPVPFNPLEFGIAPRDIEATDTSQLLGLVAAKMAIRDAGIDTAKRDLIDPNRISVILGVTGTLELVIPLGARLGHPKWKQAMRDAGVPEEAVEDAAARIAESYVPWQENSFPGLLGNVVAGRIANKLDLGGTNCVVDAACASSLSAVHLAALELAAGRCDVAVTGGVDTFNDIFMFMCFSKTPALSPSGDAKPFDAAGDGTILGEGLGIVVLKRLADAERDGDRIYAVLKGMGSSSDGKGNAIYAPSAAGQEKALRNAYRLAGVSPDTIELVEAHGTGTRVGDTVEVTALTEVYGESVKSKPRPWCALGSVKSQIGHTKAAAGAASLIKTALALYNKVLPPTVKVSKPVDVLLAPDSPFYVNTTARPWLPRKEHPRRAALSAFGFGGSNFHAVLEEHRPEKLVPDWDGSIEIWAASAATPGELANELGQIPTDSWPAFARLAEESRSRFDTTAECRLLVVAHRSTTDLQKIVAEARTNLNARPDTSWTIADSVFYGRGPASGTLAVVFPGQGSQYVGMLREIVDLFPEALDTLAIANRVVAEQNPDESDSRRLSDLVFPPPVFDADKKSRQDAALKATDVAQPALGAVSLGLYRVFRERFGIQPAAVAGHSYGELSALNAAGRLTDDELFRLSRLRGRLMADQRTSGDPGTMLAVFAPLPAIESAIQDGTLSVVVANKNAPTQTVLSGATAEIARAETMFGERGIRSVRLSVAAAFHSPLVADASRPFRAALDGVEFHTGTMPVFANTTAAPYPDDPAAARDLLGHQLANPVAFADEVRAMAESGVRTFVEVGPGPVLSRLIEATLAEAGVTDAAAIASDSSFGKRSGVLDLAIALARIAVRGHAINLREWESGSVCRPQAESKPGLTVPVSGANVVQSRPKRAPRPPISPTPEPQVPSVSSAPQGVPAMPEPARGPATDPASLAPALRITQETLTALQKMQEQTARLHKQFLDTQEQAQRTLFALVNQQGLLFPAGLPGLSQEHAAPVVPAPVPTPSAPNGTQVPPPAPAAKPASTVPVPRTDYRPASAASFPLTSAPVLPNPAAQLSPPPTAATPIPQSPRPTAPVIEPSPSPSRPASSQAMEQVLMEVVSEKTGYPVDMLDLDMSLDADLGVDSIKRVEILSALQERLPDAPIVKPEHLGTLHTLRDVILFLTASSAITPPAVVGSEDVEFELPLPTTTDSLAFPISSADPALAADLTRASAEQVLMAVVAEKTGYPVDMLDLGMSLDADLGVDSIKRVEILSTLQERLPDAPIVKPEHLGTLHTLRDVASFLAGAEERPPSTAKLASAAPSPIAVSSTPAMPVPGEEEQFVLGGVPVGPETKKFPGLDQSPSVQPAPGSPPLNGLESSSIRTILAEGVYPSTVSFETIDRSTLQLVELDAAGPRESLTLAPGVIVIVGSDTLAEQLGTVLQARGITSLVVPWSDPMATDLPSDLAGLILVAPSVVPSGLAINKLGFLWLKAMSPQLRQASRGNRPTLVASVARLDGGFGLAELADTADPISGGLAGLVKTVRHEWPEVACKAIDLAPDFAAEHTTEAADAVVDELLIGGPIEIGIAANHRSTLELARSASRPQDRPLVFGPRDVVLVTGGGRGVTGEVAVALAQACQPTLVLTGRTPAPTGSEPDWLQGRTDPAEMKKAIAEYLGTGATPKAVAEYFHRTMAQREITSTLAKIEAAGGKGVYLSTDIAIGRQVADLLHQVQVKYGPVTGLIHGAGVLADKRIEDLTPEQFDQVYSTKIDGLRNLLDMLGGQDLRGLLLFSSTTGRLGRTGQLAYAVANEVLNKTAQVEARRRRQTRVVAINWGPWDGGMVTPALKKLFESEGVGVIPLADGGKFAVAELVAGVNSVEVIALGKPPRGSKSGSGPLARSLTSRTPVPIPGLATTPGPRVADPSPPSVSHPAPSLQTAFERTLDIATHPVLKSHVLDGRAVLPMALHMEWLAHAALHGNPGLVFHGFNDLRITHGVMVEGDSKAVLTAMAGRAVKQDKFFHIPVELRGKRRDGRETIHSRAEVVLAAALPKPPSAGKTPEVQPYPHPVDEVYRYFLFHGPELHGIEKVEGLSETAFVATAYPAPPPGEWFENPLRSSWVADPLVIDASFQMMILWSFAQHGSGSLPCFAGRYRQYRRAFPAGPVQVVIKVTRDNGSFARADMEFREGDGQVIATMQDYECVIDRQLDQAFRRNQLAPKARA